MLDWIMMDYLALIVLVIGDFIYTTDSFNVDGNSPNLQYHLSDNTPAGHLVGNVLSGLQSNQQIIRAMLNPDTFFRITNHGDLMTRDALDRDTICSRINCCDLDFCQLTMEAYLFDSRPNPTTLQIKVFVADENDNPPVFPKMRTHGTGNVSSKEAVWELAIPESAAVGSTYNLPSATDADSPRFGVQSYKLFPEGEDSPSDENHYQLGNRSPFSLLVPSVLYSGQNSLSAPKLQVDQPLDRESKASYDLRLVAEDFGSPPLRSSILVRVNVVDINDNPPIFVNSSVMSSTITIPEDIKVGSTIKQFVAKDADDAANGNVTYFIDWVASNPGLDPETLQKISSKFKITPRTGQLRVMMPLDYENEQERRVVLLVKAADQGVPSLTASTTVTVIVTDVNDNMPVIEVMEVEDADVEGSSQNSEETVRLMENDPEPRLLKLISVSDKDSVSNGKLSCKLSEDHIRRGDFVLKAYSATMYGLLNSRSFDYERDGSKSGHLSVSIECTDSAEPRKVQQKWIKIPLGDLNDNWPRFSQANYQFYVNEDVEVGTEIGKVYATDEDSGPGGQIRYELSADRADFLAYVNIDQKTGQVHTAGHLDREKLDTLHFHVTALDGGDIQPVNKNGNSALGSSDKGRPNMKTNTTGLTIFVLDVNDNTPSYEGPSEIHIPENTPIGTEILPLLPFVDPDLGSNGTFKVSLVEEPHMYSLNMVDNTATSEKRRHLGISILDGSRLVTTGPIDREQQTRTVLTLVATDQGNRIQLSTTTSLTVIFDDINDNAPRLLYPRNASLLIGSRAQSEWISGTSTFTLPADTPTGTLVSTVRGKDPDAGENGSITYHLVAKRPIKNHKILTDNLFDEYQIFNEQDVSVSEVYSGFDYFTIDETTGQITTAWGEQSRDTGSTRTTDAEEKRISSASNKTDIPSKKKKDKPKPGLYVLHVELRDCGTPVLITQVMFYVNISEAVGGLFGFGFFTDASLSNTIILVLIMVCSLALIISLTAAIFWVRFRSDQTCTNQGSNRNNSAYEGPTVITQNHEPNGYFYSTNYPPLGSPADLSEMEHGYGFGDGTFLSDKDGAARSEWADPGFDFSQTTDYQPSMYGGALCTARFENLSRAHKLEVASPVSFASGAQIIPASSVTEMGVLQGSYTPLSRSNWICSAENYAACPTMVIRSDMSYNNFSQVETSAQGLGASNSTGGSDSGVDSGAGVIGSFGPNVTTSPTFDMRKRGYQTTTPVGKIYHITPESNSTLPRTFAPSPSTFHSKTLEPFQQTNQTVCRTGIDLPMSTGCSLSRKCREKSGEISVKK
ncbi:unnamed protein product [Calicophoron daubneyi]|uniref:Cadherin domain-containing protein n=1 Tax=Calicophoron daubneyi TaxID=300641 RepID=A0AAV2THR5_CALDB